MKWGRRVLAVGALALMCGCASDTILLADADVTGVDGGPPAPDTPCLTQADCPIGVCAQTSCGSPGTCAPSPPYCPADELPVCGCDRVTYFNDCLRQAAGVAPAAPGPCGGKDAPPATRCSTTADCPLGAYCGHLLGFGVGMCPSDAPGMCWMLPSCPVPSAERWNACGMGPKCVDTCTAVASGKSYHRASGSCLTACARARSRS